jgi:hypothetical protein
VLVLDGPLRRFLVLIGLDEVEGALMDTCEGARINLTTVWNNDPWNKDAYSALSNTLKTRK